MKNKNSTELRRESQAQPTWLSSVMK